MNTLPPPSDTPRIRMHTGTLSGLDVLTFGRVAPGAVVELTDGSTAEVLRVTGKRLSRHGITRGSAEVKVLGDHEQIKSVSRRDIATVLREPSAPALNGIR